MTFCYAVAPVDSKDLKLEIDLSLRLAGWIVDYGKRERERERERKSIEKFCCKLHTQIYMARVISHKNVSMNIRNLDR